MWVLVGRSRQRHILKVTPRKQPPGGAKMHEQVRSRVGSWESAKDSRGLEGCPPQARCAPEAPSSNLREAALSCGSPAPAPAGLSGARLLELQLRGHGLDVGHGQASRCKVSAGPWPGGWDWASGRQVTTSKLRVIRSQNVGSRLEGPVIQVGHCAQGPRHLVAPGGVTGVSSFSAASAPAPWPCLGQSCSPRPWQLLADVTPPRPRVMVLELWGLVWSGGTGSMGGWIPAARVVGGAGSWGQVGGCFISTPAASFRTLCVLSIQLSWPR